MGQDVLVHHLRLFGVRAENGACSGDVRVGDVTVRAVRLTCDSGTRHRATTPQILHSTAGAGLPSAQLRTFHDFQVIDADRAVPVVVDDRGQAVWAWVPDRDGVLLIGTDLAADITLLRQGAPAAAANRPTEAQWGIAGERPTYLFEGQLDIDHPHDRQADWWMWTLRDALCRFGGIEADDVLPFGAPGAVIVTGDDDQAPLDDYREQGRKLGALPITYFLHPLTKHDLTSLADHSRNRVVEWELHPDALDTPGEYADRLREQCAWFSGLTARRPRLLRNHGFLNDGYWGHAGPWISEGIEGSSNLPGFDGRVLNGSLLPARLALDGSLTPHWSLLTTFGDGVFFVHEWSDQQALEAVQTMAQRIVDSGVPGIIVLNLHPANHEKAAAMHEAAHRLVERYGFAAMTMGDALTWFSQRDAGVEATPTPDMIAPGSATRSQIASDPSGAHAQSAIGPVGRMRGLIRKFMS